MNRPQFDASGKRPPIPITDPAKRQRNQAEQGAPTMADYEQTLTEQDEQTDYEQTLGEYTEAVNSNDQEPQHDYSYLNFLG